MIEAKQDVPDTNVGNMISRQAAIDCALVILFAKGVVRRLIGRASDGRA